MSQSLDRAIEDFRAVITGDDTAAIRVAWRGVAKAYQAWCRLQGENPENFAVFVNRNVNIAQISKALNAEFGQQSFKCKTDGGYESISKLSRLFFPETNITQTQNLLALLFGWRIYQQRIVRNKLNALVEAFQKRKPDGRLLEDLYPKIINYHQSSENGLDGPIPAIKSYDFKLYGVILESLKDHYGEDSPVAKAKEDSHNGGVGDGDSLNQQSGTSYESPAGTGSHGISSGHLLSSQSPLVSQSAPVVESVVLKRRVTDGAAHVHPPSSPKAKRPKRCRLEHGSATDRTGHDIFRCKESSASNGACLSISVAPASGQHRPIVTNAGSASSRPPNPLGAPAAPDKSCWAFIAQQSLPCLQLGKSLDDDIINGLGDALMVLNSRLATFHSSRTSWDENGKNPDWIQPMERGEIYRLTPLHKSLVVTKCRVRGSHWICVTLDPVSKSAEVYDFGIPSDAGLLSSMRVGIHTMIKSIFDLGDSCAWPLNFQRTPLQRNGYDCGVYVLVVVIHRSADIPIPRDIEPSVWRAVLLSLTNDDQIDPTLTVPFSQLQAALRRRAPPNPQVPEGRMRRIDEYEELIAQLNIPRIDAFVKELDLVDCVASALLDRSNNTINDVSRVRRDLETKIEFRATFAKSLMIEEEEREPVRKHIRICEHKVGLLHQRHIDVQHGANRLRRLRREVKAAKTDMLAVRKDRVTEATTIQRDFHQAYQKVAAQVGEKRQITRDVERQWDGENRAAEVALEKVVLACKGRVLALEAKRREEDERRRREEERQRAFDREEAASKAAVKGTEAALAAENAALQRKKAAQSERFAVMKTDLDREATALERARGDFDRRVARELGLEATNGEGGDWAGQGDGGDAGAVNFFSQELDERQADDVAMVDVAGHDEDEPCALLISDLPGAVEVEVAAMGNEDSQSEALYDEDEEGSVFEPDSDQEEEED